MQALIDRKIQDYLDRCTDEQKLELVRRYVLPKLSQPQKLKLMALLQADTAGVR